MIFCRKISQDLFVMGLPSWQVVRLGSLVGGSTSFTAHPRPQGIERLSTGNKGGLKLAWRVGVACRGIRSSF